MDWSYLPSLSAAAIGLVGFCLMTAAFVMISRQGGWNNAMQADPQGKWPLPKRLMVVGAGLGALFGILVILSLIPGGFPWNRCWRSRSWARNPSRLGPGGWRRW